MAVQSTVVVVWHGGNANAVDFSFDPLVISVATDLEVVRINTDDTETPLNQGLGTTDYSITVNLSNGPATGYITYPATLGTKLQPGEYLRIRRLLPMTQSSRLSSSGGYDPRVVERELDRGIYIDQQLQEQLDRSVKLKQSKDGQPGPVMECEGIPNYVFALSADGSKLEMVPKAEKGDQGIQGIQGPPGQNGAGTGDMLAAQNLNDLVNKATARTNLGVAIGTNVQAWAEKLDVLAALTWAANKIILLTGAATASVLNFLDEDNMASNDAAGIPSQQSVKAYVDAANTTALAADKVAARYYQENTANVDLSTVIPNDDTVPTSAEGTQILSQTGVVVTGSQRVRIRVNAMAVSTTSNGRSTFAVFRGTTCIQAICDQNFGNTVPHYFGTEVEEAPGAGTYTYSVRAGAHTGVMRLNGNGTGRLFGGASRATMVIEVLNP